MGDSIFKHHTYGEAVKIWNNDVFGKSVWGMPRKGFAPYNQIQEIRAGKTIVPPKSIAQLNKVEDPKPYVKPKTEKKKDEPVIKSEPKGKGKTRKTKAQKEAETKAKADKKESAVKNVITQIIHEEAKPEEKKEEVKPEEKKTKPLSKTKIAYNKYMEDKMKAKEAQEVAEREKAVEKATQEAKALEMAEEERLKQVAGSDPVKAYDDFLREQIRNSSNQSIKGIDGALTHVELKELEETEKVMKEKAKALKTADDVKAFKKEQDKLMKTFKSKVSQRIMADHLKESDLKKARDLAKGIVAKPVVVSEGKSYDWSDIMSFANKKKASTEAVNKMVQNASKAVDINPDEDWRAKGGYKDTDWKDGFAMGNFNRNSQLPKEYNKEQGYSWLNHKYGALYAKAIEKAKHIVDVGRPSMTDKEFKEYIRLPFENTNQMKDFFRDVLLADPAIYQLLHINAHSTKAPATANALRDFKTWLGK